MTAASSSPLGPSRRSSAAWISSVKGSESSTSAIGASSSASATENRPIVKSVSRSSGSALPASISHMRARRRAERDELVRHVRDRGDRHHGRPAADGADAEQASAPRAPRTGARQREEGGVDVAQQLQREADVGGDDPLEILERHVAGGQLAEPAQRAEAGGRDAAVAEQARLGEVLALEVGEAEARQALERGVVRTLVATSSALCICGAASAAASRRGRR